MKDLPESRIRDRVIWQAKIGVVEKIEKLEADAKLGIFAARDFCVLYDAEVGIEIAWSTETISALGEGHRRTATGTCCAREGPYVESCFTTRLHEACVWAG